MFFSGDKRVVATSIKNASSYKQEGSKEIKEELGEGDMFWKDY
ncbi:MAG: hypothetical protein WC916_02530 [Candidatus Woesearchaeota archaeon]